MPEEGLFLVGIPTYNGWRRVEALLTNLRQRTNSEIPHVIVVCDDSGREDHRRRVREICGRFSAEYIEHPKNKGVPAAWNTLVRSRPECPYAILLNDDVLMDDAWLGPVAYALKNNDKVASFSMNCHFITESDVPAIVSNRKAKAVPLNVYWRDGRLVRNERHLSMPTPNDGPPGRVMCPAGCAFGFRRRIYDMVGGFDERYFAFYEETDFGVSCAEKGFPSFTLPAPQDNYHIWSATFGSAPEIDAGRVIAESRAEFVGKWSKRLGITVRDAPDIHNHLMDRIPKFEVRWLGQGGEERRELL
jgi:GT2 family glycosyltransferase